MFLLDWDLVFFNMVIYMVFVVVYVFFVLVMWIWFLGYGVVWFVFFIMFVKFFEIGLVIFVLLFVIMIGGWLFVMFYEYVMVDISLILLGGVVLEDLINVDDVI